MRPLGPCEFAACMNNARYHGTDRAAARAADVTLMKLGLSTDNGAFLNYNKVAHGTWRPLCCSHMHVHMCMCMPHSL